MNKNANHRLPAVIVGGGAVGMALALALENEPLLLTAPWRAGGRRYALGRTALSFLRSLGVSPKGAPARQFMLFAGQRRLTVSAEDAGLEVLCEFIDEAELLNMLRRQLAGGRTAEAAPQDIAECVMTADELRLCLRDGREFCTRLLVAADGAQSAVARATRVGAAVSSFSQMALTMSLSAPLAEDAAAQWFAPSEVLALLPAGGGIFSLVWSLPTAAARDLAAQGAAATAAAAAKRTGMALSPVAEVVSAFPIWSLRRAVRAAQRTAFVGDAARVIHPLAGQGLNLGLADAALLAQCLRRHKSTAAALSAYTRGGRRGEFLHLLTAMFNGARIPPLALAGGQLSFLRRLAVNLANG